MPDALDRLIRDLSRLDASARVGALDEENARKLSLQEFGSALGPDGQKGEHNVIRPTLSATTDRLEHSINRAIDRHVRDVIDSRRTATGEVLLGEVGGDLAEEVQQAIDGDTPPPLADSTLAARRRRGNASTRTLVDTGDMLRSIKVETKAGSGGWPDDG